MLCHIHVRKICVSTTDILTRYTENVCRYIRKISFNGQELDFIKRFFLCVCVHEFKFCKHCSTSIANRNKKNLRICVGLLYCHFEEVHGQVHVRISLCEQMISYIYVNCDRFATKNGITLKWGCLKVFDYSEVLNF